MSAKPGQINVYLPVKKKENLLKIKFFIPEFIEKKSFNWKVYDIFCTFVEFLRNSKK